MKILKEGYLEDKDTFWGSGKYDVTYYRGDSLKKAKSIVKNARIYAPVEDGFLIFETAEEYIRYCRDTDQLTTKQLKAL